VIGVVTLTSPPQVMVVVDRRRWAFLLPAAVLAVLAGFKARLTLMHALTFAVEGIAVLLLWRDPGSSAEHDYIRSPERTTRRNPIVIALQLLFAIALALLGAWTAILAGAQIAQQWDLPGNEIIGAMLFGPALVVPMVGDSTLLAQRGQYTAAISSAVAMALLNLCVLLPLVIVAWHVSHVPREMISVSQFPGAILVGDPPLLFAPSVWRVDAALLVVIGIWLLPISIGRWIPSRLEGAALIACYAAYMIMTAWANRNW
jgi:Ca2+/Na+ antiporter